MNEVPEKLKEASAIATLQSALEKYSAANNLSYEEALDRFARSDT